MSMEDEKVGAQVDQASQELMLEYQSHLQRFIQEHPEHADRKDEVFQSWAIQKLAGIQLSILQLAESINSLLDTQSGGDAGS